MVCVPDLGGSSTVEVVEVCVSVGDTITLEQPIVTLEGDKATMDVPAPVAGVVLEILVAVGDTVAVGAPLLSVDVVDAKVDQGIDKTDASSQIVSTASEQLAVKVPDLGSAATVSVVEIVVSVGDQVELEQTLLSLEGDKATMDLPAPAAGQVLSIDCVVGDDVSAGQVIMHLSQSAGAIVSGPVSVSDAMEVASSQPVQRAVSVENRLVPANVAEGLVYAGPSVRRVAQALGVNLHAVKGTGERGRITLEDVKSHLSAGSAMAGGLGVAPMPVVDFAQFGSIEQVALSKIKRLTGENLHRNWVSIPHVTQFGDADITELEAFRQAKKAQMLERGVRLTPLVFLMKAIVSTLREFPYFNSSLDASAKNVFLKKYFHIGVAVDTPKGLVVPVIRDVDQKSLVELAVELTEVSTLAREKGLPMSAMQGGCFTISSLGGIGGRAFTPIINAPEVAILGVSRSGYQPVWVDDAWGKRLMLPLSLSYDHRVIDGAEGARFMVHLCRCLEDIRQLLL